MENIDNTPATPEKIWELLMENARQMAESRVESEQRKKEWDEKFEQSRAESVQRKKEWDEKFEQSSAEFDKRSAEFDKRSAEFDKRSAEFDKRNAEYDKRSAEYDKRSAALDRRIREVNEAVNGIGKSNGMFAEDFFITAIENGDMKIFGEQFEEFYGLQKRKNKEYQMMGEQDIILLSDEAVAYVEVKYRARKEDAQKIIDKIPNLRILYPHHDSRRIYLGIAAMSFDKGVEKACNESGIAIVKQIGDTVVINDGHLKVF